MKKETAPPTITKMSAPNYGLSIAVAKSSGESSAVLNLGTDLNAVTPGALTVQGAVQTNGNVSVGGPAIFVGVGAATAAGFPLAAGEIAAGSPTATGGDIFIVAGGPNSGANTGDIHIGTANQPDLIRAQQNPAAGIPVLVSLVDTTAQTLSTYSPSLGAAVPAPATVAGTVSVFTPPALPEGLYAVLIGPGTDAGGNCIAYASGLLYYNGSAWRTGGFNADLGTGSYGIRTVPPGTANLEFVNGDSSDVSAGEVTINFRCLFTVVPGQTTIPPFV